MLYFSTYQSSRQNKKLFEWLFCYLNSFLKFKFRAFRPIDQSEHLNLIWLEKLAPKKYLPLLHWLIVLLPSSYTDHYLSCLLHLKTTKKLLLCLAWSRVGHALRPIRPILISDWSKLDRWVHVKIYDAFGNWHLGEADRVHLIMF